MKNIGYVITEHRKRLNISQTELADQLGITNGYMSKLENGQKPISLKRLSQIGEALDIEIFDYLTNENETKKKWLPVIEMFEEHDVSPEDVLLLSGFLSKIKKR